MRVSRQIGWSDKSNVLYNILQELEAISCKIACSNTTTTTTIPTSCNTYVLLQTPFYNTYTGIGCDGNSISGNITQPGGITLCAQSITFDGPFYSLDSSCNPECMLYYIEPTNIFNDYEYIDCDNNIINGLGLPSLIYVCAKPGTTSGNNITFRQIGPCKCIEYQINGGAYGGTYSYIACDFSINNNIPIGAEESVIICALSIPELSDYVYMGIGVIGICNP